MNARTLLTGIVVLLTGCVLPSLPTGPCEFGNPDHGCRAGLICSPAGTCTSPCTENASTTCTLGDGGTGTSSCGPSRTWGACTVVVSGACSAGPTRACAFTQSGVEYFGEQQCSDGGYLACAPTAATACAKTLGACTGARRLFTDVAGCSAASYLALDAGFAAVEVCPADTIDNDCDGYTDETAASDAVACGVGVCTGRSDAGLLLAYQRCGGGGCGTTELSSAYGASGYQSVDVCDGVDRDCSGVPNTGPARVLWESADEVALLGDEYQVSGDRRVYRAVVAERGADGGFNIVYFRINPELTTEPPARFPVGPRARAFKPKLSAASDVTTAFVWRESASTVGFATSVLNLATRLPLTFSPPITVVRTPEVAAINGSEVLLSVGITDVDGGVTHVLKRIATTSQTVSWNCGGIDCFGVSRLLLNGNGRPRTTVTTTLLSGGSGIFSTDSNDILLLADGTRFDGGYRLPDGGLPSVYLDINTYAVRLMASSAIFDETALAQAQAGGVRLVSQVGVSVPYVYAFRDDDEDVSSKILSGAEMFPEAVIPDESALVGAVVDGGTSVLFAARFDGGSVYLAPSVIDGGGLQVVTTGVGAPALAWSSKLPQHALLATPESMPDGGTSIIGRLVCMPQIPIR